MPTTEETARANHQRSRRNSTVRESHGAVPNDGDHGCMSRIAMVRTCGAERQDIDWLNGELRLQRAVVKQIEGEVKTVDSGKPPALDPRILDLV